MTFQLLISENRRRNAVPPRWNLTTSSQSLRGKRRGFTSKRQLRFQAPSPASVPPALGPAGAAAQLFRTDHGLLPEPLPAFSCLCRCGPCAAKAVCGD